MKDVIDLDGTCLKSVHPNDGKPADESNLGELYLKTPPYKEIVSLITTYIDVATRVIVTGRKSKYKLHTETWIKDNMDLDPCQYEIEYLGFVDYKTYVDSKISRIVEIITGSPDYFYRVFEDDENIIEGLESRLLESRAMHAKTVHLIFVKGGRAWKRKLTLKKKP